MSCQISQKQEYYRCRKSVTQDFVTEECDRLLSEDFDEWISHKLHVNREGYWHAFSINQVKVSDSFDNILSYDKGWVVRSQNKDDAEIWIFSEESEDSEEIKPRRIQVYYSSKLKKQDIFNSQENASKIEVIYKSPKYHSHKIHEEESIEEMNHDRRLSSVVILQKLQHLQVQSKE